MMPVCDPAPTHHATAFSSPGWTQHSYWAAPRAMEQNVWDKFESAVTGPQGILRAKAERDDVFGARTPRLTADWTEVLSGKADVAVVTADCLDLMERMPDACVDYVFTDPPYDASVQYGELSLLWNAWLKQDTLYADRLLAHEIVRNERQQKSFEVYHALLQNSFRHICRLLAGGRFLTLTFHNPTFKVRNAAVRAGVSAGFDFEQIHHQPLARTSPKALLQPFGSADGDFYLRFGKPVRRRPRRMVEITEARFRRIVIETCREVLAERAEPSPYTLLINYVDPKLARLGYFGALNTGLDVKTVLEAAVGTDFDLIPARLGGIEGTLWWFHDPRWVKRLTAVPLSERVEQTVVRLLQERRRVTFLQVWDAVTQDFPHLLTPDSIAIRDALAKYARRSGNGLWTLRDEVRRRLTSRPEIVAMLASIGKASGHGIWIGGSRQDAPASGVAPGATPGLWVTARPDHLDGVENLAAVLDMDLLWLDGSRVVTAFEVEATAAMASGLLRGSHLPRSTPKVMVLPEEREPDLVDTMASPLFAGRFRDGNWRRLHFDALRQAYLRQRGRTDVASLLSDP
jgi:hypothetical protein